MKRGKALWKTLVSASASLTLAAGAITPALAEDTTADTAASDTVILPVAGFTKTYKEVSALSTTDAPSPEETFTFTKAQLKEIKKSEYHSVAEAPAGVQEISIGTAADETTNNVTFTKGAATNGGATAGISIRADISKYERPGVYFYDFQEKAGDTAGVVYNSDTYRLMLPVVYETDNTTLKFDTNSIHIIRATKAEDNSISYPYESGSTTAFANKVNTIENQYLAGGLKIQKFVTGNLGDKDKAFTITVTLNAPENKVVKSDIKLKVTNPPVKNSIKVGQDTLKKDENDDGYTIVGDGWSSKTIEFQVKNKSEYNLVNIPADVTYTVSESVDNDYVATFSDGSKDISTATKNGKVTMTKAATMDATLQTVIISNRNETTLDTGVFLNNMPYIVLVAAAGIALVFFMKNQKHQEQE